MKPSEEVSSPESQVLSRRAFVGRLVVLTGAGAIVPTILSGCNGDRQPRDAADGESVVASECPGYDELTDQDLQMRDALDYVDDSPYPDQICANCRFWIEAEGGSECGGCELFRGPVAPQGYCVSWAPMEA